MRHLERQQISENGTWKRLNNYQRDLEDRVDKFADGMDTLAEKCATTIKKNYPECANELETISGRIDSITEVPARMESKCPDTCKGCDTEQSNQLADAPAPAQPQPSS